MQFQAGLAFMTGPPGQPLRAGASVIDIMGACSAWSRRRPPCASARPPARASASRSALFENAAFLMSTHMAGMAATGLEARPMPARRGAWAIYEVFNTADGGQLFIGVTSDPQWARFVEEFGLQELAADPRLATNVMRLAERAWLIPALQEVLGPVAARRGRKRAASAPTCRGRRSASRAICSTTRTCWPPAGWSTCCCRASAAAMAIGAAGPADRVRRRPPASRPAPASRRAIGEHNAEVLARGRLFSNGRSPTSPKAE